MAYADREVAKLFSVQESILSCQDFSTLERDVLAPAAACLGAATSCFVQFRADSSGAINFGRTATLNVPAPAHQGYLSRHFHGDPVIHVANRNIGIAPHIFCTSEISDYRQLVNSGFYNDFFRPTGIHHVLVMAQRSQNGDMLMYGFHRPRHDRPFAPAEKKRLRQLASALGCAARLAALKDDILMHERAASEYESAYPRHGLLFLDQQMAVTYANRTGLRHLALRGVGDTVRLNTLVRACGRAMRMGEPVEAVPIDGPGGHGQAIASVRIQPDRDGRPSFIVHTSEDSDEALFSIRCREYQLSPREIDITRALAAGLSNTEISERLCISVRTVENHLRSIYAKAGVSRRTQLMIRFNDFEACVASR